MKQAGDIIKLYEGLRLQSYLCPALKWTIGWGHTGPEVHKGMVITEVEAEGLLTKDLTWAEASVGKEVKVVLNSNQASALSSFVFNLGTGAFTSSTLLKRLNAGEFEAVPLELLKWCHAGGKVLAGLRKRREAEGQLFKRAVAS